MNDDYRERLDFTVALAREAGAYAHAQFLKLETLTVERKGHQDMVTEADRATETLVRAALARRWPEDGIVGEEHARVHGTSGFDWVIDPIDGTANFVSGIPHWCTVIACCKDGVPVVGVIFDPCTGELFRASKGGGAYVGEKPLKVNAATSLSEGSIFAGVSGKSDPKVAATLIAEILGARSLFFRAASGALGLAYVAAGRLLGGVEDRMNSWDCFAALLMLEEAGGRHQGYPPGSLDTGTKVVAGGPGVHDALARIAAKVYG
ncbi:inositol monophosphatase family protein [Histidinibacterium lentulum]|uniref:Inositol-1-monophosphatase n=1 Tax=Histidinibacterium lentulum TaxID=2480588 RepID=A0A3N2R839_9RHOB|nr:inositol monophosphatase [Histidinibacterium lentulum]ROU03640.1 inositol monophosphatase [Histidinibacterium lentulum]